MSVAPSSNPIRRFFSAWRSAYVAHRDTRQQFRSHVDAPILVVTRSMNDRLYAMSDELLGLPYPRVRVTNCPGFHGATRYLFALFQTDAEWVINVDEDAFVFDPLRILALLDHMRENEYVYCGNPDGGVCRHRFHNPVAVNPFFNIYHAARIRPKLTETPVAQINATRHSPALERFTPEALLKPGFDYAFDDYEPFYGFFFWLLEQDFKPLYLDSRELEDGLTTELFDHEGAPFLWHTWFARQYDTDPKTHARIEDRFEEARRRRAHG